MSESVVDRQHFEGWAILELLGRRKLAGYILEVQMFGSSMCRIDVPGESDEMPCTQYYSGASIYCLTPTTEETARRTAEACRPAPVEASRLPMRLTLPSPTSNDDDREDDDEDDEYEDDDDTLD